MNNGTSWRLRAALRLGAGATAMLISASLALVAAPTAKAADAPIMKVAISSDIDSLNPFTTVYATPINILRYQYEALVDWDRNNKPGPGMSDKWETSSDGLTWTFHLPDGRKWSDGEAVTAEDPAFTYNKIMTDPKMGAANGSLVENFASAVAKDKNTLVITLKAAQAANPATEIPIVPKHVWDKVDGGTFPNDASTGPIVGSGPYTIQKYSKGQSIELKTNPNFWRGPAKIGGITYAYYTNTEAAVKGLQAGEVDFVSGLTATQFNTLKADTNVQATSGTGRRYFALNINHGYTSNKNEPMGDGNPALQDVQLRKAIMLAINNEELLAKVLGGLGKPGLTQQPAAFPEFFGLPSNITPRKFDPAEANRILDAAGYVKGADGMRLDKTGKPLTIRLFGRSNDATQPQLISFITAWLKDVGINCQATVKQSSEVGKDSTMGTFDMYFGGWGIPPDPDFQLSINTCAARPNLDGSGPATESSWCKPEFDKLYQAQRKELDPAKRAALVKQAYGLIYEQHFLDVLYYADTLEAFRKDRFSGFTRVPEGGPIYGQSSYWGFYGATPVVKASASPGTGTGSVGGLSTGAMVGIGVAVAAVIGVGAFAATRRKGDDKE